MSTRPSALAFQLAGSGHAMGRLLDRLDADGYDDLRRGLRTDSRVIVPVYTVVLVGLCVLSVFAVRAAADGGPSVVGVMLALLFALIAVVAGVLDLGENRALGRVLDGWQPIPIPAAPEETEAAERQERRRTQVAAIDPDCRTARSFALWKWRLLALVVGWLLVAAVIALTDWLST